MRLALLTILPLGIAGCASNADWAKEPLPVSVSAANYSELSREELYARVNDPATDHPKPPPVSEPDRPLFYGFVPGEIYASDVPLETVYRELAIPLAHRGYFNVVYQAEAGYLPKRVDYLLRIHCGVRHWRTPTVRTDNVTWGNAGLISNRRNPNSVFLFGEAASADPRAGQDPASAVNLATYLQGSASYGNLSQNQYSVDNLNESGAWRDTCVVMVEAFKFSDVMNMGKKAPCIWATFIAVPTHAGQEFSDVLRTMARTATPYFGKTTDGIQVHDVPGGNVNVGEPVEIPALPSAPQPTRQASPQTP
jgi:hypothetical protein